MPTDTSAKISIFKRRESEARSYCRSFDTVFTRAQGSELTDRQGRTYIDFLAGCSSLNYGHNDPDMKAALIDHISADGLAHGLDFHTSAKADFLDAFDQHILRPRNMDHKVMFTGPTGANAVEAALKLARKVTGRHQCHRLHQRLPRRHSGRAGGHRQQLPPRRCRRPAQWRHPAAL